MKDTFIQRPSCTALCWRWRSCDADVCSNQRGIAPFGGSLLHLMASCLRLSPIRGHALFGSLEALRVQVCAVHSVTRVRVHARMQMHKRAHAHDASTYTRTETRVHEPAHKRCLFALVLRRHLHAEAAQKHDTKIRKGRFRWAMNLMSDEYVRKIVRVRAGAHACKSALHAQRLNFWVES